MEPRSRIDLLLGDEQGREELRRLIAEVRAEEEWAGRQEKKPLAQLRSAYREIAREDRQEQALLQALLPLLPEERRQRAGDALALMRLARMLELFRELDIIREEEWE